MAVCGIVAEYDPFHTGHKWQIEEIKRQLGGDCAVLCVLSGNWTQRGTPALLEKHQRTRLALLGGSDLVLELPLPWATASAEGFARGGVEVLRAAGVVTHLCFGSEAGTLAPLQEIAGVLETPAFQSALRQELDQGLSFPAARQRAAETVLHRALPELGFPNNTLGLEYLRALGGSGIQPVTVPRQGAGHNGLPAGGYASAGFLRGLLRQGGLKNATPYLPADRSEYLGPFTDFALAERCVLDRLRRMTRSELALVPDCGEGLSNRLYRAIRQETTLEGILTAMKTKRYTLSRLRRIVLYAWLGLTGTDRPAQVPYLRVLGCNARGQALLQDMKTVASLPVLTKPAAVRSLSEQAQNVFALEVRGTDCWGLCLPELPPCGAEWLNSPVVLP